MTAAELRSSVNEVKIDNPLPGSYRASLHGQPCQIIIYQLTHLHNTSADTKMPVQTLEYHRVRARRHHALCEPMSWLSLQPQAGRWTWEVQIALKGVAALGPLSHSPRPFVVNQPIHHVAFT